MVSDYAPSHATAARSDTPDLQRQQSLSIECVGTKPFLDVRVLLFYSFLLCQKRLLSWQARAATNICNVISFLWGCSYATPALHLTLLSHFRG